MIKSLLVAGTSAIALSLSGPAAAQELVEPEPMTWPEMGFDPADLDPAIDPGDDFWAYVNGKWDAVTPIPPQYSYHGVIRDLRLKAERSVAEIVADMAAENAPEGSIAQRVGDSYAAFVDVEGINARGLSPIQPLLEQIYAASTYQELARLFALPGIPDPFFVSIHPDQKNPDYNILNIWIGGYALPDRDNYLVDSENNREMQAHYKDYVAFLLGKAGYSDPAAAAEAVYGVEYGLAALAFDRTLSRNPELLYNVVPRSQMVTWSDTFPLQSYLNELLVGDTETLIVDEMRPDAQEAATLGLSSEDMNKLGAGFPAMVDYVGKVPLDTWKAWMVAHLMQNYAPFLPSEIDRRNFEFWGTFMSGTAAQRPREQRAISVVESQLGEAVGELYIQRHFPQASKDKMIELVGNLQKVMQQRIDDLAWMSDATKQQAQAKLAAFRVKIGYPDEFEDYEGLAIRPDDPIGNQIASNAWAWDEMVEDLGQPVDKTEWHATPQTVNAYYSPTGNEIVFPAGYLQPPNFALNADPAVNYGIIGTTIGHEISHGFDNTGSKFDGTGALKNWWTEEDRSKFDAKTAMLVEQYNAFCPIDNGETCINGRLTLGENIADLAGLTIAYYAYKLSLGGEEAPVIDGLTGDQRFFIAYAIGNRSKWTEEFTRQILQTDPHSPDIARTNLVLRNFDPWYEAFDVTEDDELYLPPEQRVRIW
ncbi:MAG TPA: M13 family metallopeptidase [Sphingomonadaceae bacterium]|nr:M13 family metallopeptidase [Sphingomonadaceae bacterium]